MTPYDRLRPYGTPRRGSMEARAGEMEGFAPPPLVPQQGLPMTYMQGVGDEAGDDQSMNKSATDIGALLGQYLKKRQGSSAADAEAAWKAGGSL